MTSQQQLNRAIEISLQAHDGQLDKNNGRPYIEHPFRVMNAGHTLSEKIVGVLHDVVEDSDWTLERLSGEGFSSEIISAIDALTRRKDELYDSYLERVKSNSLAVCVKRSDLTDNMDIRRSIKKFRDCANT